MHLENFLFFHWPLCLDERSEHKAPERSEVIAVLLFIKFQMVLTKNLPQRTERKRSSIEFERSENIGQFFLAWAFNYFKVFKCF